ncbi:hypothetical protein [Streptomyces sp. MNU89]|uniref:hypothetical protein n=1 Tax=Streptomyces sp. MNU89 TaxID=2560025 RepID=UPI001E62E40F|nr:hypothetical protein [Streptomyces sp. MNU89]MCC9741013.1 hypothetical protein [Streptomyces sp. MNU89]
MRAPRAHGACAVAGAAARVGTAGGARPGDVLLHTAAFVIGAAVLRPGRSLV